MTKIMCLTLYLRSCTSYDCDFWYTCVKRMTDDMREEGKSKISFCYLRGLGVPFSLFASEVT